jgi:hypothetical protein
LREAFDAVLPRDLAIWVERARAERVVWRRDEVPMEARKPRLLRALNGLYSTAERAETAEDGNAAARAFSAVDRSHVPWLSGPEDSWL